MRMSCRSFGPYVGMLMSGVRQPMRKPRCPHVTVKARSGGGVGSGAEVKNGGQDTALSVQAEAGTLCEGELCDYET